MKHHSLISTLSQRDSNLLPFTEFNMQPSVAVKQHSSVLLLFTLSQHFFELFLRPGALLRFRSSHLSKNFQIYFHLAQEAGAGSACLSRRRITGRILERRVAADPGGEGGGGLEEEQAL